MATTTIAGQTWRVSTSGTVTARRGRGAWAVQTRGDLLALDVDGEVWAWLRAQGVRRPSPSGTTVPETEREGGRVRLDGEAYAAAGELAARWGCSVPEAVGRAVGAAVGSTSASAKSTGDP